MSVKVRRTPLFGVDGHLGIPVVGNKNNNNNCIQVGSQTHVHCNTKDSGFSFIRFKRIYHFILEMY